MPPSNAPGPSPEMPAPVMSSPELAHSERPIESVEAPAPQEVRRESTEAANQNPSVALPPVQTPPQQVMQPVSLQPAQQTVQYDDSPVTAADVDVIEREWVNKAKVIISQTRHDPFLQEQQLSQLQKQYLKKRYGKEIKPAGEGE